MSRTTPEQLAHLAALSSLRITPDRVEGVLAGLDSVLTFIETLQAVSATSFEDGRAWLQGAEARIDTVVSASEAERRRILENFSAETPDHLLETHGALPDADL